MGGGLTPDIKFGERVPILGSYLKFKGQNLGYLSPVFLEAKFGTTSWPPNMEVTPGFSLVLIRVFFCRSDKKRPKSYH